MQNLQLALSLRSEKKTITLFITKIVTEYKFLKENIKMKKGIHPENYRPVVFKDMSMVMYSCLVPLAIRKRLSNSKVKLIRW